MAEKYLTRRRVRIAGTWTDPGVDVTASLPADKLVLNALLSSGAVVKVHTDLVQSNKAKQHIPTGSYTVTTAAITTNVATLTIGAHPLAVGDTIFVAGATTTAALNGRFVVTAKAATTVSYALTHADVLSGAETGTVQKERPVPSKALHSQPRTDKASFV